MSQSADDIRAQVADNLAYRMRYGPSRATGGPVSCAVVIVIAIVVLVFVGLGTHFLSSRPEGEGSFDLAVGDGEYLLTHDPIDPNLYASTETIQVSDRDGVVFGSSVRVAAIPDYRTDADNICHGQDWGPLGQSISWSTLSRGKVYCARVFSRSSVRYVELNIKTTGHHTVQIDYTSWTAAVLESWTAKP